MRLLRDRRRGMSIIEILVVIAIIAVLASLILATVVRAKKSARKANCISNLRQWGIMWEVYTSDNNGYFSEGTSATGFPRGEWVWTLAYQYNEKPSLLICPETKHRRGRGPRARQVEHLVHIDTMRSRATQFGGARTVFDFPAHPKMAQYPGELWLSSYGQNNWAYNVKRTLQGRLAEYHWREKDVAWEASEVPLFMDAMWPGGGIGHAPWAKYEPPTIQSEWVNAGHEAKHFVIRRHGRSVNVLFFDGSVRTTQRPLEIYQMKWHMNFDTEAWKTNTFADWIK